MKVRELFDPIQEQSLDEISLKHAAAATIIGASLLSPKHSHAQDAHQDVHQTRVSDADIKLNSKEQAAANHIEKKYNVDKDLAIKVVFLAKKYEKSSFPKAKDILSIIGIESSFNPKAKSALKKDPAMGLMQFRPEAWNIDPSSMKDIETQISKGTEILHTYYRHLYSNKEGAIKAYNIGLAKYKDVRDNPEDNEDMLDAQERYMDKYKHEASQYDL